MRSDAMKANTANRDPAGPHQPRSPHHRTNGMPRKRTRFRSKRTTGSFQSAITGARKRYKLLPIVWPPSSNSGPYIGNSRLERTRRASRKSRSSKMLQRNDDPDQTM